MAVSAHQGSSEAPGPIGCREPPEVEPVIFRFEYEKVVYDSPKPNSKRGVILFYVTRTLQ